MFTKRSMIPIMLSTVASRTIAAAAAEGYRSRPMSFEIRRPTLADCEPDMIRTVTKSPMTRVTTMIEPIMIPGLVSGMTTLAGICRPEAPLSRGLDR